MRSQLVVLAATVVLLTPTWSAAQPFEPQGGGSGGDKPARTVSDTYTVTLDQEKPAAKPRMETVPDPAASRWVRTLTNVQVELTITDQTGTATPEKKTVSMVASSGSWGRIRSAGGMRLEPGLPPVSVDLNVDARPFVSVDGPIQLELTIAYSPLGASTADGKGKPPTVNQSLTVILQSGKPLVISQAADPVGDRKIIVEAKATVLK
jgi:hypothetical protein